MYEGRAVRSCISVTVIPLHVYALELGHSHPTACVCSAPLLHAVLPVCGGVAIESRLSVCHCSAAADVLSLHISIAAPQATQRAFPCRVLDFLADRSSK